MLNTESPTPQSISRIIFRAKIQAEAALFQYASDMIASLSSPEDYAAHRALFTFYTKLGTTPASASWDDQEGDEAGQYTPQVNADRKLSPSQQRKLIASYDDETEQLSEAEILKNREETYELLGRIIAALTDDIHHQLIFDPESQEITDKETEARLNILLTVVTKTKLSTMSRELIDILMKVPKLYDVAKRKVFVDQLTQAERLVLRDQLNSLLGHQLQQAVQTGFVRYQQARFRAEAAAEEKSKKAEEQREKAEKWRNYTGGAI